MSNEVTVDMVKDAADNMKKVVQKTAMVTSFRLSKNLMLKAENTQRTGSFKLRGAYNKIRLLTDEEKKKAVITCSAGNHAQGIALAATKAGIKSIICMPETAPVSKIEATKHYGAEIILVKGGYDDTEKVAERLIKEKGYSFIHPFNDPYVIAGQGTLGLEILNEVPDVEQVIVPVGGGGLISGVGLVIKTLKPTCKVIGAEPKCVPSMYESVRQNKIVTVPNIKTVADGLHVLTPGDLTFEMVKKYVDDIILVDENMINAAIVALLECPKLVSEGAGAISTAAFLYGGVDRTKKTVCIVSGGNVDLTTLGDSVNKGYKIFEEYVNNN